MDYDKADNINHTDDHSGVRAISPEEMAHRLRPLNARAGTPLRGPGWDGTDKPAATSGQITYSRTIEGLHKLIERMRQVRVMGEDVRGQLTRDVPKEEVAGPSPLNLDDSTLPVFEHIAQLTIALSREIETTERNLALSLAVLK